MSSLNRQYNNSQMSSFLVSPQVTIVGLPEACSNSGPLEQLDSTSLLSRTLSVGVVVSLSSSFARHWDSLTLGKSSFIFQDIGEGNHGQIYELVGTELVYKVAKDSTVRYEYNLHRRAFDAFKKYRELKLGVKVCEPHRLLSIDSLEGQRFWEEQSQNFTNGHCGPSDVLICERVLPLPKVVRHALIDKFLPENNRDLLGVLKHEASQKHALARIYMGRKTGRYNAEPRSPKPFNLRNFPLYLEAMQELHLDLIELAFSLGKAMAVVHWAAGLDGEDIEFVLGTKAMIPPGSPLGYQNREVSLYVIDFGGCSTVKRSEKGVHPMWGAIVQNDPYFPIPGGSALWESFRAAYLSTGKTICEQEELDMSLPAQVIEGIENFYE